MSTNRLLVFANDHIYHIYNRGVERRTIFTTRRDYQRMVQTLWFYRYKDLSMRFSHYLNLSVDARNQFDLKLQQNEPLVSILAHCLMPNHFHLIVKQRVDNGIPRFVSNVANSYTKYFNTKNKRIGPLFQGIFKAVLIETEEQFMHVTRYVHINPVTSFLIEWEQLEAYEWSSFPDYITPKKQSICDIDEVNRLVSLKDYRTFVYDQVNYARELGKIKHLCYDE
jgi:putative transposase